MFTDESVCFAFCRPSGRAVPKLSKTIGRYQLDEISPQDLVQFSNDKGKWGWIYVIGAFWLQVFYNFSILYDLTIFFGLFFVRSSENKSTSIKSNLFICDYNFAYVIQIRLSPVCIKTVCKCSFGFFDANWFRKLDDQTYHTCAI